MRCWECKKYVGLHARYIDGETLCYGCFINRCAAHVADDLEARMESRRNREQTEAEKQKDVDDAKTIAKALISRHMVQ